MMSQEEKENLHPVENTAPASQKTVEGKLKTGEDVTGVRWLDPETKKEVYQMEFEGKLYMANKVGEPAEWLFELI